MALTARNDLEYTFLEMLQFNMNVDSAVYTKYYFDLRQLAETVSAWCPDCVML